MKFTEREKAIKKERQYAERRFTQLLAQVNRTEGGGVEYQIEIKLIALDNQWRDFCKNLVYLKANGENEFMKVARKIAYPLS